MTHTTTTIECETCRKLFDVCTALFKEDLTIELVPPVCPEAGKGKHVIRTWPAHHPCPRCRKRMIKGEMTVLWD